MRCHSVRRDVRLGIGLFARRNQSTQPQLQPAWLKLSAIISQYVMRHLTQINEFAGALGVVSK